MSPTSRGATDWCGDNRITKRRREGKGGKRAEQSMKGLQMRCLISIARKREGKKGIMERPWNQSYEWLSGQTFKWILSSASLSLVWSFEQKCCTARWHILVSLQLSCEFSVGGMDGFGRSASRAPCVLRRRRKIWKLCWKCCCQRQPYLPPRVVEQGWCFYRKLIMHVGNLEIFDERHLHSNLALFR